MAAVAQGELSDNVARLPVDVAIRGAAMSTALTFAAAYAALHLAGRAGRSRDTGAVGGDCS